MNRLRFGGVAALALALLGMLCLTATASAVPCGKLIADHRGGYEGPRMKGFACKMPESPLPGESRETTWTVPAKVKAAEFLVFGGSAASSGHGGEVDAALPVTPGETLTLLFGIDGSASSVSRSAVPLIVAAGSDGQQANYISPTARNIAVRPPRFPAPPFPQNGSIYVTWLQGTNGQVPGDCVVPRLWGKRPVEVREMLVRAHCRVGSIGHAFARPANRGLVTGQSPKPGTVMPAQSRVDLRIGRGRGSQ
jgi:hypothetical protein